MIELLGDTTGEVERDTRVVSGWMRKGESSARRYHPIYDSEGS